jgi:hypothetical protein
VTGSPASRQPSLKRPDGKATVVVAAVFTAASGLFAWAFMRGTHPRPTTAVVGQSAAAVRSAAA